MRAVINRDFNEIIECSDGIVATFYLMIGGRRNAQEVREIVITYDNQKTIKKLKSKSVVWCMNNLSVAFHPIISY